MRFTSSKIHALIFGLLLLVCCFAHGQGAINIDYAKGSRWPAFGVDSGAANAYVVTTVEPLGPALKTGSQIIFIATHANSGASTVAVDGGAAIAIKKNVTSALTGGEIPLNGFVSLYYDGTNFQLPFTVSTQIAVNGTTVSSSPVNFNDTTPAAAANGLNTKWQFSGANVSNYVPGDGNATHCFLGNGTFASCPSGATDYRTCAVGFGTNNGGALVDADISPQVSNRCYLPSGATIVEIMVTATGGTPSITVAKNHLGSDTNLTSSALATAPAGARACSNSGGTTSLDGSTTCSSTLTTTSAAAGDYLEPNGGVAGGTATALSAVITWTVTATNIHECMMSFGGNNGTALANADLSPQIENRCYLPAGSTVTEIMVTADAGTPNISIAKNHLGSDTNLTSSALATASSGGRACSNAGGTTGLDGSTTCSSTLTTTSLVAGDFLEPNGGSAGGTAKAMSVAVTYTTP